jgi:four helix bundle protein
MAFQFEKLEVYQKALSIPLNIAEGNGRWHKGEKRQFFWIARGSVFECVPIMQVLYRKNLINEQQYAGYYDHLDIIAKMLTNLVKSVEELKR